MVFPKRFLIGGHDMIKAAIFDLDGTLADTLDDLTTAMNGMLKDLGYPLRTREELRRFINRGVRYFVGMSLPEGLVDTWECNLVDEAIKLYKMHYAECYADETKPYEGLPETIGRLAAKGYRLGVLSNKLEEFVKITVDKLYPDTFLSVHGQTTLPEKPDPTMAYMVAKELGVKHSECVFVGDSDVDMKTGVNAGMIPIGVTWGYRSRECLEKAGAAMTVDTPSELFDLICNLGYSCEGKGK